MPLRIDCVNLQSDCESLRSDCESLVSVCVSLVSDCECLVSDCENLVSDCESLVQADCDFLGIYYENQQGEYKLLVTDLQHQVTFQVKDFLNDFEAMEKNLGLSFVDFQRKDSWIFASLCRVVCSYWHSCCG